MNKFVRKDDYTFSFVAQVSNLVRLARYPLLPYPPTDLFTNFVDFSRYILIPFERQQFKVKTQPNHIPKPFQIQIRPLEQFQSATGVNRLNQQIERI